MWILPCSTRPRSHALGNPLPVHVLVRSCIQRLPGLQQAEHDSATAHEIPGIYMIQCTGESRTPCERLGGRAKLGAQDLVEGVLLAEVLGLVLSAEALELGA